VLLWAGSCKAEVVTVGTAMPMPPHENFGIVLDCNSCVLTSPSVPNGASDVSPVDGVIIRWHLNKAVPESGSSFRLRVLARHEEEYLEAGRSDPETPVGVSVVETYPANLPIQAGQLIGLELENSQSKALLGNSPRAESVLLEPAIADGEAGTAPTWWDEAWWAKEAIFPFNAEILPTPRITKVGPTNGPAAGGNQVVIEGANFAEVTSVSFGSTEATYTVDSESEVTATVPAGVGGSSVPVFVVTAAGRAEAAAGYVYEASPTGGGDPAPTSGCLVPRLKERRLKAVKQMLSRRDCRLGQVKVRHRATTRSGRVKRQSPSPGTMLPSGGKVAVAPGLAD
jgi:IPT/TIG domain/PASTA domain